MNFNADIYKITPLKKIKIINNHEIYVKRDDLIHPLISGNKWRKLYGQVIDKSLDHLISFGGAFSNHLVAVAFLAHQLNIQSIGFVRTDRIDENNPTLKLCQKLNMTLIPINREEYKLKELSSSVQEHLKKNKNHYLIPEGGTNQFSSLGFQHLMHEIQEQLGSTPDIICCSYGTGGTSRGFATFKDNKTKLFINPAIKGLSIDDILTQSTKDKPTKISNISILPIFDNLRYGKINDKIMKTVDCFLEEHDILLDPIYTAKLIAALEKEDYLTEHTEYKTMVIYHSGGIQGWGGIFYLKPQLKTKFPNIFNAFSQYLEQI